MWTLAKTPPFLYILYELRKKNNVRGLRPKPPPHFGLVHQNKFFFLLKPSLIFFRWNSVLDYSAPKQLFIIFCDGICSNSVTKLGKLYVIWASHLLCQVVDFEVFTPVAGCNRRSTIYVALFKDVLIFDWGSCLRSPAATNDLPPMNFFLFAPLASSCI